MSLQFWYPFNKGDFRNNGLIDSTITNHNCTFASSLVFGQYCGFNGSSSYFLSDKAIDKKAKEWSYCAWVYANNSSGCIYSQRTKTDSNGRAIFLYESSILFDNGNRWTSSTTITTGSWIHYAFTYSSTNGRSIYINGELADHTDDVGDYDSSVIGTTFTIGGSQNSSTTANTNWFKGDLVDVRIYDHCLSKKEIKEISKGLVLHYKLNGFELSDMIEYDCSGFGHDGYMSGTFTLDSSSPKYDNGYYLAKACRIGVDLASENKIRIQQNLSISIWYYPNLSSSTEQDIICCYEGGGAGLNFISNKVVLSLYISGYKKATSSVLDLNQWYHIVGTYDGQYEKLYINGELVATTDIGSVKNITYSTNTPWTIGTNPSGKSYGSPNLYGKISDARIYTTTLSADDVKELYNASAVIDNNGNLYSREFYEGMDTQSISNKGIVNSNEFTEDSLSISADTISAKELYEF